MAPGKGRALFATDLIRAGEVIESAPVVLFGGGDADALERTAVGCYYFWWDGADGSWTGAIALGYLTLCNHAEDPSAYVLRRHADLRMDLVAGRTIEPGEEVTIRYGCELWFEPAL